jgi:hypothetical protein
LRIAYLSQQQLKGFNLPYQLGYSSLDDYQPEFQTPLDSDTGAVGWRIEGVLVFSAFRYIVWALRSAMQLVVCKVF